jgi:hypothetical protein
MINGTKGVVDQSRHDDTHEEDECRNSCPKNIIMTLPINIID